MASVTEKDTNDESSKSEDNVSGKSHDNSAHSVLMLPDMLTTIFRLLSVADRGRAAQVCQKWREAIDLRSSWRGAEVVLSNQHFPVATFQQRQIRKFELINQDSSSLGDTLQALADCLPDVESLKFTDCFQLRNSILQEALPTSGMPRITHLSLRNCHRIIDGSIELISRLMPNLVFLNLCDCRSLSDNAVLFIVLRLRHLTCLDLSEYSLITNVGIGYLVGRNLDDARGLLQSLQRPECQVVADNLAINRLLVQGSSIFDINIGHSLTLEKNIIRLLSEMRSLKHLSISFYCRVSNVSEMFHLAKMTNLRRFRLVFSWPMTDTTMFHLDRIVRGFRQLNLTCESNVNKVLSLPLAKSRTMVVHLEISSCDGIGSEGWKYFVSQLQWLS